MTHRNRPPMLAALVATAMLAAACGLPVGGEVETLSQDDHNELIFGTTSTTIPVPEETTSVALYFVGPDNKLEAVIREFPEGTKIPEVLDAVANQPLEEERDLFADQGGTLQTLLPAGLEPVFGEKDLERESQPIIVNPEAGLRQIVEEQPVRGQLIAAQIVCTVLRLRIDGISGVEIFDGGEEAILLSDVNAEPLVGPATREDFADCITGTEERERDATSTTTPEDGEGEGTDGETDAATTDA